jgi:transposase
MTSRDAWSDKEILYAYNAESSFEQTFSLMKNPHHFAVRPQYHWTDQKVRVHMFICLLALMLGRLLHKEAREKHQYQSTAATLLDTLGKVRLAMVIKFDPKSKKSKLECQWMIEIHQDSIVEFFKSFVPQKEPFVYTN